MQTNGIKTYTEKDKRIMTSANEAKDNKADRVEELINYCKAHAINNIGIANCIVLEKETQLLAADLQEEGFTVNSINCKTGKIPHNELVVEGKGIACNPIGQAEYLANKTSELNISVGLCMGHDILFNLHSKAPTTTLIVKDRKLKHKPIERFESQE